MMRTIRTIGTRRMLLAVLLTAALLIPCAAQADSQSLTDGSETPVAVVAPDELDVVELTRVKRAGGKLQLKWKAVPGAEGYRVEYARNALWNPVRVKSVRKRTGLTLKLKAPETWCVRVKAYARKDGKTVWSADWASSMMTESAEAKVTFLRKGGERFDLRKEAGARLKYHDISQGACSDGKNLYVCMEYRTRDKKGNKTVEIRIAKVRLSDRKILRVSGPLAIGHANSLVYNNRNRKLVATGYKKADPCVRLIDPRTLRVVKTVRVNISRFGDEPEGFNAMGYDSENNLYYLRARDYFGYVYVLNNRFVAVDRMELDHNPATDIQGFCMEKDCFFLSQSRYQTSDKNTITIFDREGRKLQDIRLHLTGELESVFRVGNRYYGTVHVKSEVSKEDRSRIREIQRANRKRPKTERKSVQPIYTKYRKTYVFRVTLP